jgi:hypothetical protein
MKIYLYQQEREWKSLEIALGRRTLIEDLVWDGRKDTFHTVQGQQKIEMLSDTIVNPKTLNSIVAYLDCLLTRNQKSWCLSNVPEAGYVFPVARHGGIFQSRQRNALEFED